MKSKRSAIHSKLAFLPLFILTLALLPGCGSSTSGPGLSLYAGNYAGIINTTTSATTLQFSINSLGFIVGSTVDPSSGTITDGTGTTDGSGNITFTLNGIATTILTGSLVLNTTTHELQGTLKDSSNNLYYVLLGTVPASNSTYAGTYSGTFSPSGGTGGQLHFTVGPNGGIQGTLTATGGSPVTVLGSVDSSGNLYLSFLSPSGGTPTVGLGSGQLTGQTLSGSFTSYVGNTPGTVVSFTVTS